MTEKQTIIFIINPVSGGKRKERFIEYLNQCKIDKFNTRTVFSDYPGNAYEIAKAELLKGAGIIVAVGGDGTINEVGRALSGSDACLGIIPFGSGNGFARHFNIPLNYKKALQLIIKGETKCIDAAKINNLTFFCTSGIGFDSEIGHLFAKSKKRGFINYGLNFIKAFYSYKSKNYELIIDGVSSFHEAFLINVANISQFGNHFYIAPEASASDGLLNLVILKKFPKWKVFNLIFRSYFRSIHHSPYTEVKNVKSLVIKSSFRENNIHIDGEPESIKGELHYKVLPDSLKIIC